MKKSDRISESIEFETVRKSTEGVVTEEDLQTNDSSGNQAGAQHAPSSNTEIDREWFVCRTAIGICWWIGY